MRNRENIRFYRATEAILKLFNEEKQLVVFSEIVKMYDTQLQATEMIILVTPKSIYLLNSRCNLKVRYKIEDLVEIIHVKVDPSFLALSFDKG